MDSALDQPFFYCDPSDNARDTHLPSEENFFISEEDLRGDVGDVLDLPMETSQDPKAKVEGTMGLSPLSNQLPPQLQAAMQEHLTAQQAGQNTTQYIQTSQPPAAFMHDQTPQPAGNNIPVLPTRPPGAPQAVVPQRLAPIQCNVPLGPGEVLNVIVEAGTADGHTVIMKADKVPSNEIQAVDTRPLYQCGYCQALKPSEGAGTYGKGVRIRCECGGKHADGKTRMHANWTRKTPPGRPAGNSLMALYISDTQQTGNAQLIPMAD